MAQQSTGAIRLIFGQTLSLFPYFMCANSKGSAQSPPEPSLFAYAISTCTIISWPGSYYVLWQKWQKISQVLGEKAIDYLMKFIDYQDETTVGYAVYAVKGLMRKHKDFLQKYVSELKTLKQTATLPYLTEMVHQMLLVLEGKRYYPFV